MRFPLVASLLLASVILVANSAFGAQPSAAADALEIPVMLPMTGPGAFGGKAYSEAATAVENEINRQGGIQGRSIRFVMQDDQGIPQTAVQLLSANLSQRHAVVIDGGPLVTCRATAALVQGQVTEYCLSPSLRPEPGSGVFSNSVASHDVLLVSLRYLSKRGLNRVAVLSGTDATGQDADESIADAIKLPALKNVKIVAAEHFNLTDLSVVAQLTRIKAANPQALIAYVSGTAIATILRGLGDVGLDVPVFTSPGNMSVQQLDLYRSIMPRQLLFAGPPVIVPDQLTDAGVKAAVERFRTAMKAAGVQPDFFHAAAWDPFLIVATAFQKRGANATARNIQDEISGMRSFIGSLGRYDFPRIPQRGLGADTLIVAQWVPDHSNWIALSRPGGSPL